MEPSDVTPTGSSSRISKNFSVLKKVVLVLKVSFFSVEIVRNWRSVTMVYYDSSTISPVPRLLSSTFGQKGQEIIFTF